MGLSRASRRRLRGALVAAAPWLEHPEAGPQTVDAGQCDRCDERPRLLPTCGPVPWRALCRACGLEVGTDAWCDGHADLARDLLAWARALPTWWGDAVVLWWVATGEVDAPARTPHAELPEAVRAVLPTTGHG